MTRDEAIERARQHAFQRGWTWSEPTRARRERAFRVSGRLRWIVTSASGEGMSARVIVDDATGRVDGARLVNAP